MNLFHGDHTKYDFRRELRRIEKLAFVTKRLGLIVCFSLRCHASAQTLYHWSPPINLKLQSRSFYIFTADFTVSLHSTQ